MANIWPSGVSGAVTRPAEAAVCGACRDLAKPHGEIARVKSMDHRGVSAFTPIPPLPPSVLPMTRPGPRSAPPEGSKYCAECLVRRKRPNAGFVNAGMSSATRLPSGWLSPLDRCGKGYGSCTSGSPGSSPGDSSFGGVDMSPIQVPRSATMVTGICGDAHPSHWTDVGSCR